jgi:hypothetical protein
MWAPVRELIVGVREIVADLLRSQAPIFMCQP